MSETKGYPNSDETMAEFWNELGPFWVEHQARLDERLRPYGEALLDAAAPAAGERGLDIGCGCGDTTLALARRIGAGGAAVGLDVSRPMIAHARARASALREDLRVTFIEGDAGRTSLPVAHFDLAISRFGVMFFEQPARSFAHLRQSLRRGARFVFICWRKLDENPWMEQLSAALKPFTPPVPPPHPGAPGPFSLGDPDRIRIILSEAGFRNPVLTPFDCLMNMGPDVDTALDEFRNRGSIAAQLETIGEPARERAIAALRAVLAAHARDGAVRMHSAAWIVSASA